MSQSNIIAAYLFIAFVIFITMRGELRTYLGFFVGGGTPAAAPNEPPPAINPVQSSSSRDMKEIGKSADLVMTLASFAV